MQIFPFRMTPQQSGADELDNPNIEFWKDIKEGYDRFELSQDAAELGRVRKEICVRAEIGERQSAGCGGRLSGAERGPAVGAGFGEGGGGRGAV